MMTSTFPQDRAGLVAALKHAAATGAVEEAERLAEELCRIYGDQEPEGFIYLAGRDLAKEDRTRALERLLAVSERFAHSAEFQFALGTTSFNTRQGLQAEAYYRKALSLRPEWAEAGFRVGHCLHKAGRYGEALPFLKFAAEAEPNNVGYQGLYGHALISLEKFSEARREFKKALALEPNSTAIQQTLKEIEGLGDQDIENRDVEKKTVLRRKKWPASVADFRDLRTAVKQYVVNDYDTRGFILKSGMIVLTQGSCFARNLAAGFSRYPLAVANLPLGEEHNSTFANAVVLRWLLDGATDDETRMAEANIGADKRSAYLKYLRATDLYVFTLGVAPVFFDKETGRFQMPNASSTSALHLARNCTFRTTSVTENVEQLTYIIEAVKSINPNATIVITVSPVPLNSTLEMSSAVIADCVSKSTLRVAAHELTQAFQGRVQYWPSFEIVRWLSTHHGVVFGADDGSSFHVNNSVVEAIVDSFIDVFGAPDLKGAST
ncbi:MAG: GSCFA domain-containing protein [Rhodospirillaceae bacterium]